ncbi:MAG TPA: aldehyde dehydrogenase family protein, partial [Candidatus Dormibacteraeota bacterium]
MSEIPEFHNLVGGDRVPARSGRTFESVNPADRADVVGVFPRSGAEDVADAVAAACRALPGWRRT